MLAFPEDIKYLQEKAFVFSQGIFHLPTKFASRTRADFALLDVLLKFNHIPRPGFILDVHGTGVIAAKEFEFSHVHAPRTVERRRDHLY